MRRMCLGSSHDAPQEELAVATNPVVLIGHGDAHVKPEYHEVVLQPTGKWAHDRAVWSTVGGIELHLYSDARGNWCLSDTKGKCYVCTPGASDSMGGSLVPPSDHVWKLDNDSICNTSAGTADRAVSDLKLTLLCGAKGAAQAVRGLTQHTCMYYDCMLLRCASATE